MIDLAVVYEFVEAQEDYLQLTTSLNRSQLYSKETLLPYLKVNHDLLRGHIGNTIVTLEEIQDFLEKYGVLEVEGKHDE